MHGTPSRREVPRLALLIGIDRYTNGIPPLHNAVNDVRALAEVLRELHGYQVHCLLDEQATLAGLRALLAELPARVTPEHRLVLYFATHGIAHETTGADGPQGYLVPQDASRERMESFLAMAELQGALQGLPCKHLLLLLDCCFAGAFRWSRTRDIIVPQQTLYRERYERYLRDPAWQVITSTAHDERALDVVAGWVLGLRGEPGRNSPFATALCAGLRGEADLAIGGAPGDGIILASELYLYLEEALKRLEERLGTGQQRPMLWSLAGRDKGEFIFEVPGRRLDLPGALDLNEQNNPHRGLQPYDETQQRLFFGRRTATEALLGRIMGQTLTVVLGASGTGKSSLVLAGLVPLLRGQSPAWHVLPPQRPGSAPLAVLQALATQLLPGAEDLTRAVRAWCADHPERHLALVLDQAEELVTLGGGSLQDCLQVLSAARRTGSGRFHLVLTLRSDFEPHFREWLGSGESAATRFLMPPMTRAELREVIERPASERVLYFESPHLVDVLVSEVIDTPGALPLLSFALSGMYQVYVQQQRGDRVLAEADYQSLGGVTGALSKRALEVYHGLDPLEQGTLRRVLLRMVVLEAGEAASRRVERAELRYGRDEDARVERVLQRLLEARLLVAGQDATGARYVEPAHQRLVLGWPLLWRFIQEAQETLPLRGRLGQAALDWERGQRQGSRLWSSDPRLAQLVAMQRAEPESLNALETEFVLRSVRRRRRGQGLAVAGVLALLAALAIWALRERRSAYQIEQRLLATYVEQGRKLLLEGERLRALLWLNRAYEKGRDDPALPVLLAQAAVPLDATQHVLLGHTDEVRSVAFSPDGRCVVTASADGTARLWDAGSGAPALTLKGHTGPLWSAAFSPDGARVLTAASDSTARLWDARTGAALATLDRHQVNLAAAAFSPDGALIATAGLDDVVWLWDGRTGRPLRPLTGHKGDVHSVAFSPDGARVISASDDRTARLWDVRSGQPVATLAGHTARLESALFSPDGERVVTAGVDDAARIWDGRTGRLLAVLAGHSRGLNGAVFSPDGARVVTASADGTGRIWEAQGGRLVATLIGHRSWVDAAVYSPDGALLATASHDGTARLWDAATGATLATLEGHRGNLTGVAFSPDGTRLITAGLDASARIWQVRAGPLLPLVLRHGSGVNSAEFSPDGARILTVSSDATAKVWDAASGALLLRLEGHRDRVEEGRFSPDGARIVTASQDRTARIWDASSGRLLATLTGHADWVTTAAFSPDGGRVITASQGGGGVPAEAARIWDARTGALLASLSGHSDYINQARFSGDGARALTASHDHTVRIWDARSGQPLSTLTAHQAIVTDARFSPDGAWVLSAAMDDTARIWDSGRGDRPIVLQGHTAEVWTIAVDAAGAQAVTASQDGSAKIWDARSGALRGSLEGHAEGLHAAAFSPDGHYVVTASADRTVRVWDAGSSRLLATLAGHAGEVQAAAFSPDGTRIVSASRDGTARVWTLRAERRSWRQLADLVDCQSPYYFTGEAILSRPPRPCRQVPPGLELTGRERGQDLLRLSRLALRRGDAAAARAPLAEAAGLLRDAADAAGEAQARWGLGFIAAQRGETDQAMAEVQRARALLQTGDSAREAAEMEKLANFTLEELGDADAAIRIFAWALELRPADPTLLAERLQALLVAGRSAEVLRDAHVAVEAQVLSERRALLGLLAWMEAQLLGRPEEAAGWARLAREAYARVPPNSKMEWSLRTIQQALIRRRPPPQQLRHLLAVLDVLARQKTDAGVDRLAALLRVPPPRQD